MLGHHSFKTYSDHGRDHDVLPARNSFHTPRTPFLCRCGASAGAGSAKLRSIRPRKCPRSHCSHGKVNVRLGRFRICGGKIPDSASTNNAFCVPGR